MLSMLDTLHLKRDEKRYRTAPLMQQLDLSKRLERITDENFHNYEKKT